MAISPSDDRDSGLFSPEEQSIIRTINKSKIWRLMRDALCLERERLFNRTPSLANDREVWIREGALQQVQRLLREGPHLAVYYDRYMRAQAEQGAGKPQPSSDYSPPSLEE